jgi:type II secretory ATPase GspE/PulE/Tfp pilus assembly ATPase PilB-like protein
MDYTDEIKSMILQGKSTFEIERYALQKGMVNLERDGAFKMIRGILDLDEVYRFVKNTFM